MKRAGRNRPYSAIGIGRVPCARCGDPSKFQWQCCANDNRWMGVCAVCDIALNALVILDFFRLPGGADLMSRYEKKCLES